MDPTPGRSPAPGLTLGHYRLIERIGAGGMGEVWRARDERLERDVALKLLLPGLLADEAARKRFRREALALSKLAHPNIATVFDFDTEGGLDFLVMEHVAGPVVTEHLAEGPLLEAEVARLQNCESEVVTMQTGLIAGLRAELDLLQKDSVSIFEWLNRKGGLGYDVHNRINTFLATWSKT